MLLGELAATSRQVAATRSRKAKTELLAATISKMGPAEVSIGVAYLSSVCTSNQYSISWHTNSLITRTAVTAHELGHSFSAGHCNGTTCFIMCASIGGCNGVLTAFAPISINAINNHAASRSCLN